MLVKTTTILHRNEGWPDNLFVSHVEEGDRSHVLALDPDVLADLGNPETITVTIEPGDKLNPE